MDDQTQAILDRLDRAVTELAAATKAAIELARAKERETAARLGDEDDWTRMPAKGQRCPISKFSRSKLNHLINDGRVRKERREGCSFYSGADVRKILNGSTQ